MPNDHTKKPQLSLRERALLELQERHVKSVARGTSMAELIEELQVHQVELEMQNEELRRAQTELADNRDRYLDLYEMAPVGYATLDEHRTVREANLTLCKLVGLERKQIIGRKIDTFAAPEYRDDCFRHFRTMLQSQAEQSFELKFLHNDDSAFWGEVKCVPCGPHTAWPAGCRVSVSDITARKEAEERLAQLNRDLERQVEARTAELAASKQRYRNLVENTSDILYSIDANGTVTFVSKQIERYGLRVADLVGTYCMDIVHPDDRERAENELKRTLTTGEEFPSVVRLKTPTEHPVWIEETGNVQRDENGTVTGITGVLRDITQRVEQEQLIVQQNEDLRVLASRLATVQEQERQRIAAGLHGEVCQLLAAAKLKLSQVQADEGGREDDRLLDEADRLLEQASDEIRGLTFELSSTTLFDAGFVPAAKELCAHMEERHGIRFDVECRQDEISVPEDARPTLYHCLRELLYNVVKHAGVDEAVVRLEEDDHVIRLTVRDDGKGFDVKDLERPLTREGGFGLRHQRQRLTDIGGTLSIESIPGDRTKAVVEVGIG